MVTVHVVVVPLQSPDQLNVWPDAAAAVRVTVPWSTIPGQLPDVLPPVIVQVFPFHVTVPLLPPLPCTVS